MSSGSCGAAGALFVVVAAAFALLPAAAAVSALAASAVSAVATLCVRVFANPVLVCRTACFAAVDLPR